MATTNTKTTVKTAEAEVKKTATKTTPVKTESKPAAKAVETKAKAAKKTTVAKTTRKPAAKKGTEVKADVFVQFGGKEFSEETIMSKVVGKQMARKHLRSRKQNLISSRKMARHIM